MTRDIIFRGSVKSVNGPKKRWAYGSLVQDKINNRAWIIPDDEEIEVGFEFDNLSIEVEPETVGQYSQVINIYEGDKVQYQSDFGKTTGEVQFSRGCFGVNLSYLWQLKDVKRVGNIHENPELLEQENGWSKDELTKALQTRKDQHGN